MVQFCYKGLYLGNESVCLSCVATDDKDGHGLKRENVGPTFSSFTMPAIITKQYIIVSAPW